MHKVLPPNAILIQDNAKKVFTGQIFDVYQWPQKMFDGSTKTFELLKRPDTMQVIAVQDGKLVVVEEEQPGRAVQIHLPGGRADDTDPSWLAAAQRELLEETGKTFKAWRLINVQQPIPKAEWFGPIYLATDLAEQVEPTLDEDGEKITVHLKTFEEVRQLIFSGKYQMMSYLIPLFSRLNSLDDLLACPEFQGQEVDRP